jgi:hypothetical protein
MYEMAGMPDAWLARMDNVRSLIELADRLVARRVGSGGAAPEPS